MTPQQLKNSILQLAIQGKLVEHIPAEGTALELYKCVQKEKKHLISENKIRGNIVVSAPAITEDELPFDIPNGWLWVRLGDVLVIERGGSPRPIKSYLTESADGVNWIKIGDTDKGGKYINQTAEKIIPEGVNKSRFVHKGDFLLSNSMSFGRPYILNIDGCIHDGWLVLHQIEKIFDNDYLYYLLSSPMVFSQFCKAVSGAVVNNLNKDKVSITVVPLPPICEQRRIVEKIEQILPLVDRYGEAWSKLESFNKKFPEYMKKSILQQAIQGKLVEQRAEEGTAEELYDQIKKEKKKLIANKLIKKEKSTDLLKKDAVPFNIPKSWKWVKFGDITINRDSERIPLSVSQRGQLKKIYDYYGASGVIDKVEDYLFDKTLLLIGEDGANLLSRSTPIAFLAQGKYWVNNHAHVIDCLDNFICLKYIMYYINAISLAPYVTGTAQPKMNQAKMNSIPVALPPFLEQQRIVSKIEELLPLCNSLIK